MRATAENLMAARLMGVAVNRTILAAFAIGSALAAVAGLLWGGKFGQIDPLMGFVPGLKAFVACVIGGVGLDRRRDARRISPRPGRGALRRADAAGSSPDTATPSCSCS